MPCEFFRSPDGRVTSVICSRKPRTTPCHYCGRPSTILCDFPVSNGKTCDKPMCESCRSRISNDLDVCREHNNPEDIETTKRAQLNEDWEE